MTGKNGAWAVMVRRSYDAEEVRSLEDGDLGDFDPKVRFEQCLSASAARLRVLAPDVRPRHVHDAVTRRVLAAVLMLFRDRADAQDPIFAEGSADAPDPTLRALAALAPCDASGPPPTPGRLAAIHQTLQDCGVLRKKNGFASHSANESRKRSGSYFTSAHLARGLARRALENAQPDAHILDPAAGAGAFLIAALDELAHDPSERAQVVATQLFGVERDPVAASLARWSLWLAAGAHPDSTPISAAPGIHTADALTDPPPLPMDSFDVVLGNPPWDTVQPMVREFFGELIPDYRRMGRAAGSAARTHLLARDSAAAADWAQHVAAVERFSAWVHSKDSPYTRQGTGKLYTYRLFLERSWHWLRDGGRLGLLLPAGLYFDQGAADLRKLLLDNGQWEWLFGFENRRRIFPADSRLRFGAVVAQKGGQTQSVRVVFQRTDPDDLFHPGPVLTYSRASVDTLSPHARTFVEVEHEHDLDLLERLGQRGRPFIDSGFGLTFAQGDFNMTSDAHRFAGSQEAPTDLPLQQGAMIDLLHPAAAHYDGGAGHSVRWTRDRTITPPRPQFWIRGDEPRNPPPHARLVFRTLSNATNERTCIAAVIPGLPCGNSLGVLTSTDPDDLRLLCFGAGVMTSLVFDWSIRLRMAGTNLNRFVLRDLVWPDADERLVNDIAARAAALTLVLPSQERDRRHARRQGWWSRGLKVALRPTERHALRQDLDRLVAEAFGLTRQDLQWVLRDCDLPDPGTADLPSKGFWRIDRNLPPADRHPVRVLQGFDPS